MGRKKFVVGNWKMNGSIEENQSLFDGLLSAKGIERVDIAVCVPSPYFFQARGALSGTAISWGAQNVSEQDSGAYTGEVSAKMLVDLGAEIGLVGHSERRSMFGESSGLVGKKAMKLIEFGISPVVCVGETLDHRKSKKTLEVMSSQLKAVIEQIGLENLGNIVLAYEPVWAIGTGLTASPEQAQEVHSHLRQQVRLLDVEASRELRILYGGSVKPDNAEALFGQEDVDGGLIGGASLNLIDFLTICRAAVNATTH